jgi:hypothetical protein
VTFGAEIIETVSFRDISKSLRLSVNLSKGDVKQKTHRLRWAFCLWVKPFNTRLNPRYVNDRLALRMVHPSSVTTGAGKAKPKYIGGRTKDVPGASSL